MWHEFAKKLFSEAAHQWKGELRWNEPLSKHTSYRVGGPADLVCIPTAVSDLELLAEVLKQTAPPLAVVGMGSNLLVSDDGFRGLVIKTTRMNLEIVPNEKGLRVGASVPISSLLGRCCREGWEGFEYLTGVPGSAGGAVFMNAGTHIAETGSALLAVETVDLYAGARIERFEGDRLAYSYRKNHFIRPGTLVWAGEWRKTISDPKTVTDSIQAMLQRRKNTQPIEWPSCGSVFKNPTGTTLKAWQVIEKLGLRGVQVGQAQISTKHANFIVNLGGASARDIIALIDQVKDKAKAELGIVMETEVQFLT